VRGLFVVAVLLAVSPVVLAALTFEQLGDDVFSVSHAVKGFGGRGVAMDVVYEKTASLCIAAGYTHLKVMDQQSTAGSDYEEPNATVQVQFLQRGGEGLIKCDLKATQKYIDEAKKKLGKRGYKGPVAPTEAAEAPSGRGACTIAQIMTMTKSGLSEEQIKAACPDSE